MPVNAWVMLGILILMFVFLVWDRFPAWLVFMGTLTTAMTVSGRTQAGLALPERLKRSFHPH